ncbi:MAG: helix-turn-helix domain-containing protein [Gammaproteobacteria bacterium]
MKEDFITVAMAAQRLGVSPRWLAKLCADRRIPGARKPGRDWMIPVGARIEPTGLGRPLRTLEIPRAEKRGKR